MENLIKANERDLKRFKEIYNEKGLNGLNHALKQYKYKKNVLEFGFSKKAAEEKNKFINTKKKMILRFHYYSIAKTSRKSGWTANLLRAVEYDFN